MEQDSSRILERVRKLLAKAEAQGVTVEEAGAFTAKAAELMARYGIDRARLAATRPETDQPADRVIRLRNPWAQVRAVMLSGLAGALRCEAIQLNPDGDGVRVHLFGYQSDLERADMLFTSLLLQMTHALTATPVPVTVSSPRAWRRSWLLGYVSAVTSRVRDAEQRAAARAATGDSTAGGPSTALVLADRSAVVARHVKQAYPSVRTTRPTFTGLGYQSGYAKGQRADIGQPRMGSRPAVTR